MKEKLKPVILVGRIIKVWQQMDGAEMDVAPYFSAFQQFLGIIYLVHTQNVRMRIRGYKMLAFRKVLRMH